MEFELGRTYSGYKFLDVANRSKTAVEYRVQNTLAQRMELLKALPPSDQGDQEAADRFLREMRVRARLAHPNIVTFFTALPLDGQMVMTTELFDGLPLAERLLLGPLAWQEALEAARQLLAAAACAHSLKIVHRDITPANIVMGADGVLKLTNFRFAVAVNGPRAAESGAIVGSPKYISPEQVKGVQELDERSDLYSIGIVLYEMLCGRTPFDGCSQFEVMLAHVNQRPTPPADVNPSLPRQLNAIVLKAIAKDPEHRYQTAVAFADALEWISSQPAVETIEPEVYTLSDLCQELPLAAEAAAPLVAEAVAPPAVEAVAPLVVEAVAPLVAEAVAPLVAEAVAPLVAEPVALLAAEPVAAFEPTPPMGLNNLPEQESQAFSMPDVCQELPPAETVPPKVAELVAAFEPAPPTGLNNLPEQVGHAFSLPGPCHELPAAEALPSLAAETIPPQVAEPVAAFEPASLMGLNNLPEQMLLAFAMLDFCHEVPVAEEPVAIAEILVAEAVRPLVAESVAIAKIYVAEAVQPLAEEPVAIAEILVAEAVQPTVEEPVAIAEIFVSEAVQPQVEEPVAIAEIFVSEAVQPPAEEPVAIAEIFVAEAVQPTVEEPVATAEILVAEAVQPQVEEPVAITEPHVAEPVQPLTAKAAGPVALPPNPIIQSNLWAAAALVAQAAAAPARPSQADAAMPAAPVEAAPVPAPPAIPSPAPNPALHAVPALAARARHGAESVQWAIFGSSAAFLGIIWFAIWLSTGTQ